MQSVKKHRMPKVEKVNAKEFAIGFSASAGGKNSAEVKAKLLAAAASTPETVNFWNNIVGHIVKFAI